MLDAFARDEEALPWDAIAYARANWAEAGPALLGALADFVEKRDRTERAHGILFFGLLLMMEKRETAAFAPLARLAREGEALFDILGESAETLLHRIFAGVFDGDVDRLWSIIEAPHGDEFIRGAALQTYAWLAMSKRETLEAAEARFMQAFKTLEPKEPSPVWVDLAMTAATLNLSRCIPLMRAACRKGYIPARAIKMKDLEEEFAIGRSDFFRVSAQFARENAPIDDIFAEMEHWTPASQDEIAEGEDDPLEEEADPGTPIVNPTRNVGRNDPCPCGSGNKFKKCCGASI
jgi:hypothetical protein